MPGTLMTRYTFALYGDAGGFIDDSEGEDLPDLKAARRHASAVREELTRNDGFRDQNWTLVSYNNRGSEMFRIPFPRVSARLRARS